MKFFCFSLFLVFALFLKKYISYRKKALFFSLQKLRSSVNINKILLTLLTIALLLIVIRYGPTTTAAQNDTQHLQHLYHTHLKTATAERQRAAHERPRLLEVHRNQLHRPDAPPFNSREEVLKPAGKGTVRRSPEPQASHVAQVARLGCPGRRAIHHPWDKRGEKKTHTERMYRALYIQRTLCVYIHRTLCE